MEKETVAPTGCFKCGRPGHWSRDCPSSASIPNSNPNSNPNSSNPNSFRSNSSFKNGSASSFPKPGFGEKSLAKPAKVVAPRRRPKLTPQILLSDDDGLGYILRHFPRAFKYLGRGHEVSDLGNLISMYSEWHSRLLPYYSFDQFVQKVEQVAATKRVKLCLRELRERVAQGGDPTKLHEPPVVHDTPHQEQEAMNSEGLHHQELSSSKNQDAENTQVEDMFQEIFENATEESSQSLHTDIITTNEVPKQVSNENVSHASQSEITEEQRARIEANRLKAIEKAKVRAQSLQVA
ncbi:hypothetical protein UlMin_041435 [Ulmus minor]